MSPGTYLVSGCTFPPCMLNESQLINTFLYSFLLSVYSSSVIKELLVFYLIRTNPSFLCQREWELCVCNTYLLFPVSIWKCAGMQWGFLPSKRLRTLGFFSYTHIVLQTQSSVCFQKKKKPQSHYRGVHTKTLFYHVFEEVWFPFLPWELYLCAK